jgi:hypothetical protein
VLPDAASADEVAETITHCPTGALHFTRKDGGSPEMPNAVNTVSPSIDGPLFLRGEIVIQTPDGEVVLRDTRMALCRCGKSSNRPFCDDTHARIGFQSK